MRILLVLTMTACGGELPEIEVDAGPELHDADAGAPGDAEAPEDGGVPRVTFARIHATVILPRCGGCHDGPVDDSSTRAALTYDRIVGRPSVRLPEMKLVEPGDPEASFVFRKITATHPEACEAHERAAFGCGGPMPPGRAGGALPDAEIAAVRDWIARGALP